MFNREIEAAETWMGAREAFLASEDVGGSLDGIEALIKKHEDFDKSLNAQVTPLLQTLLFDCSIREYFMLTLVFMRIHQTSFDCSIRVFVLTPCIYVHQKIDCSIREYFVLVLSVYITGGENCCTANFC